MVAARRRVVVRHAFQGNGRCRAETNVGRARRAVTLKRMTLIPSADPVADESVSPLVRKAAAWSWRLLVIGAAVVALLWVITHLELIFVPVALAAMMAALLLPAVDLLHARRVPRGAAVATVILGAIAVVGGIMTFVVSQFISGAPDLVEQVTRSIDGLRIWLIEGPAHLSKDQIDHAGDSVITALREAARKLGTRSSR